MTPTAELELSPDRYMERAKSFLDTITGLRVTRDNKEQAERDILTLSEMEKQAHGIFDPICDANYKAWKTSTTKRAEVLDPILREKNRLRFECGAVQEELEAEATRAAELAAAELRKQDETATVEHAAALEAAGDKEGAAAALDELAYAPPTPVAPAAVASETQYRDEWKFQIVNEAELPREYLLPNEKALRAHATSMKERAKVPGVRFYKEKVAVSKSARR